MTYRSTFVRRSLVLAGFSKRLGWVKVPTPGRPRPRSRGAAAPEAAAARGAVKTSDDRNASSGDRGGVGGEGFGRVVVLAGHQAVVQAAEESVEEVPEGGGVTVAVFSAALVMGAGLSRMGGCDERPDEPDSGKAIVLDAAEGHRQASPGGPGHRGGSGVCLQRAGVEEAAAVITDLAEQPGSADLTDAGKAGDDRVVGVARELFGDGLPERVDTAALGLQAGQQRQRLHPKRLLHRFGLADLLNMQGLMDVLGDLVDVALPPTAP